MKKLITSSCAEFNIDASDSNFVYQANLTPQLDILSEDFDQNIINQIVLWKVNRYAHITPECLEKLNLIDSTSKVLDVELTKEVLKLLLKSDGIRLPMASTILRFRNKNLYQIIDQRVYRIINNENFPLSSLKTDSHIDSQIEIYLDYLRKLKEVCTQHKIDFHNADRVLYMADKRLNKSHKIIGW